VLYNPASAGRRKGLARAIEIFSAARPPHTPAIHAFNVGRANESLVLSRLDSFDQAIVGMMSLIIIGACQTRLVERAGREAFVYTPRGYLAGEPA
jgi:precorrin-3B methylase